MVRSSSSCVLCGSVLVVRPAVIHNVIPAAENVVSLPLGSTSEKMGMEVGLAPGEGQGTGVGSQMVEGPFSALSKPMFATKATKGLFALLLDL